MSVSNVESALMKLLLLGTLRYLGIDFNFDEIKEATAISSEVYRIFSLRL